MNIPTNQFKIICGMKNNYIFLFIHLASENTVPNKLRKKAKKLWNNLFSNTLYSGETAIKKTRTRRKARTSILPAGVKLN